MSLSEENDRIFAVKNVLSGSVAIAETNCGNSDEFDQTELLNLAEELLEKLAEFFGKYN